MPQEQRKEVQGKVLVQPYYRRKVLTEEELLTAAFDEVKRENETTGDYVLTKTLSVNDFIQRIRGDAGAAQAAARAGAMMSERDAWARIAATAVARIQVLLSLEAEETESETFS